MTATEGINLNTETVSKAVDGLLKLVDKGLEIVDVPLKINLVVTLKKVPVQAKAQTTELNLPHSTRFPNQSVCLFVKDLDVNDREYEKTKYFYQDLLKNEGLSEIPDIIPIKELLIEYKAYEAKKNLSNMYDVYLTDSRVAKVLPRILGKHFYGRKRIPKRVIMDKEPLKDEIEGAINRCYFIMAMKGSNSMVAVAHNKMDKQQVTENVLSAVEQISKEVPSGSDNIRNFYIRTADSISIPLFVSLDSSNDVNLPAPQEVEMEEEDEPEELSTLPNGEKVKITKTGDIEIYSAEGQLLPRRKQSLLIQGTDFMKGSRKKRKLEKSSAEDQYDKVKKSKMAETKGTEKNVTKSNVKVSKSKKKSKMMKKVELTPKANKKKTKPQSPKVKAEKVPLKENETVNKPKRKPSVNEDVENKTAKIEKTNQKLDNKRKTNKKNFKKRQSVEKSKTAVKSAKKR